MRFLPLILVAAPSMAAAQLLPQPPRERCEAAPVNSATARVWLDRAAAAVLPPQPGDRVLRYRVSHDVPLWEQSDRMYEPFIPRALSTDRWLDLTSGVEARQPIDRAVANGMYPTQLTSAAAVFAGRDTLVRAIAPMTPITAVPRYENPWLVLTEWRAAAAEVHVAQRCFYRDNWRIVLEHAGDKLYLAESDGTPIKLDRTEPHYLWGQVHAEYVWATWWGVIGGGYFPFASFRIFDGSVYERIGVLSVNGNATGAMVLVPRDSAPRLVVPTTAPPAQPARPSFDMPDTVRISANTVQLVTPAYTETVTLRRDTVFLLDATSSEARARNDSAMIAALFPGKHPTVVVVTDLAWPHVSGLRFWVARGAIVVSHPASQDFLTRIIDHPWTLNPDALEKTSPRAKLKFRAVKDSLALAGGELVVHWLQGSSTELALGVWIPADRYFWAGDYIQNGETPYIRDVVRTVRALGLTPLKVGAEHIKPIDWTVLDAKVPRIVF